MKTRGGKNIYGYPIGILMLETRFPRIPGDMGNASTWDFPVLYKIVKTATPDAVVRKGDPRLLDLFVQAARELEKDGVRAITTNCGFLAMFHKEMVSAVNIPVFTSSLMQVPLVYHMLKPTQKVGIITVHAKSLSKKHLSSVGADTVPHVIMGTEGEEEFTKALLNDKLELDVEKSKYEMVKVSEQMILEYPEVGAIVLECTNMPPYAADIQEEIGLPVFDIYTLVTFVYHAVVRKRFSGIM
ncbi:MAG: aspartate/glutamate racemase family protein [Deltaproteobacteria bacterium]|nr:aspartate/glutamate racemase family protein [Deltaproteobacteria bacterium]MBW1961645.1 aspartate/glutamate racemase family protein [Deltaproteobacteria bacterium]MBW2151338.1 aspartate/glutamate racemase family protein [Deltaproteobacteria bacterium]